MKAGEHLQHLFAAGLVLFFIASCARGPEERAGPWPELDGYWEGEFMPGNDLTLVLDFTPDRSGGQQARVLLFDGQRQIQDDPLSRVELRDRTLSFLIPAKKTSFLGRIETDGSLITGSFTFPDRSIHPLLVHRVDLPSVGPYPGRESDPGVELIPTSIRIPPDLLLEDLAFLRSRLEQYHPQLYRFVSRDSFDLGQAQLTRRLDHEMSAVSFARLVAPWLATIGCAHTGIRLPPDMAAILERQPVFLPLDIELLGNRLFVRADRSADSLIRPGTEIDSINGRAAGSIVAEMLAQLPSDARRYAYRAYQINKGFSRSYVHLIDAPAWYDLSVRTGSKAVRHVRMAATTFDALQAPAATSDRPYFSVRMLKDHDAALLTISRFEATNDEVFDRFLRKTFARLTREDTGNLIVDVRGNQGGPPDLAARLLAYLTSDPITYFAATDEPTAPAWLYEPMEPEPDHFRGTLYVLADGGALSTTGHFLALIRHHRLGTLIGQEPGGGYSCNDNSIALRLPNSGLDVRIARTTFAAAVPENDSGDPVPIDHSVPTTLDDLIDGIDRPMDYTLELIRLSARDQTRSTTWNSRPSRSAASAASRPNQR